MDDELLQLEAELKSLQPSSPPRRLVARLERDLAAPARAAVSVSTSAAPSTAAASARRPAAAFWFWAAALPAAAALALGVGALMRRDLSSSREAARSAAAVVEAAPSRAQLKPVAAENILYSATDEGLVILDDGTRARRERLNYVDTITWKNPRTNASLKWTVPREEIRFVPVNFQ